MKSSVLESLQLPENGCVYRVEVDAPLFFPPAGLKEVGLVARHDGEGLSLDVLDSANCMLNAGVAVLLEIPAGEPLDPVEMIAVAANAGLDLSLLPPRAGGAAAWGAYRASVVEYARRFLAHPGMANQVYPVSGYLQYLTAAVIGYEPENMTDDAYIEATFVTDLPKDELEQTKIALREVFHDHFGGAEGFRAAVLNFGAGLYDEVRHIVAEMGQVTHAGASTAQSA
jgi:hypothetical protein